MDNEWITFYFDVENYISPLFRAPRSIEALAALCDDPFYVVERKDTHHYVRCKHDEALDIYVSPSLFNKEGNLNAAKDLAYRLNKLYWLGSTGTFETRQQGMYDSTRVVYHTADPRIVCGGADNETSRYALCKRLNSIMDRPAEREAEAIRAVKVKSYEG